LLIFPARTIRVRIGAWLIGNAPFIRSQCSFSYHLRQLPVEAGRFH
jgi:hypothetical protein